jgi:two-component sensor histidine kinase
LTSKGSAIRDGTGAIRRLAGCNTDITHLKQAEERFRLLVHRLHTIREEARAAMARTIDDDLASISSGGQEYGLGIDAEVALFRIVQEALTNVARHAKAGQVEIRLRADERGFEMAIRDDGLDRVDFSHYIGSLVDELYVACVGEPDRISISVVPDSVDLGVHRAVPCALILNELVSNALKHAFPDGRRGRVTVTCRQPAPGTVELWVEDDGVGIPDGFDWEQSSSLGLQIVRVLATQLGGSVSLAHDHGTRFGLAFQCSPAPGPARLAP